MLESGAEEPNPAAVRSQDNVVTLRPNPRPPGDTSSTTGMRALANAETPPERELTVAARRAHLRSVMFGTPTELVRIDRFILLDTIGAGGMGVVYSAYDPQLNRRLALKLVRTDASAPADQIAARFLREARAMARLSHPNVVQIHEVGLWNDRPYLAMEYIAGQNLSAWLAKRRPGWREIVRVFIEAGRGLSAAHAGGIVHRDFKPDNVLVSEDGRVRVTDFGLARGRREDSQATARDPASTTSAPPREHDVGVSLTASGVVAGTPAYMSPEQFSGQAATAASDQFSFCVALYHALHGVRPFAGENYYDLAHAVLAGQRVEPRRYAFPRALHRALVRGLSRDPAERFPSMEALLHALSRRPRWRVYGATAVAALGLSALGVLGLTEDPCTDHGALLAGVWDDERRATLERVFDTSPVTQAHQLGASTLSSLDAYAEDAAAIFEQSCRDERGGGYDSVHNLRVACLERRLSIVRTLVTELETGEEATLRHAPEAAAKLDDLESCRGDAQRARVVAPPRIQDRPAVDAIERALTDARALELLGELSASETLAERAVTDARALDYAPTLAAALYQRGRLAVLAHDYPEAREDLHTTLALAIRERDDALVTDVWGWLLQAELNETNTPGDAPKWLRQAQAWLDRGHATPRQRADFELARSLALAAVGDGIAAEAASRRAVEYATSVHGPEHLGVAIFRFNRGNHLAALGRHDEAVEELRRAYRIVDAHVGHEHMLIADVRYNLGVALLDVATSAALAEAAEHFTRSREISANLRGADAPELADSDLALARVAHLAGDSPTAERHVRAALATYTRHHRPADRGYAYTFLGELHFEDGRVDEALAAHRNAETLWRATRGEASELLGVVDSNIGKVLLAQNRIDDAIERFTRAIATIERALGRDAPMLTEPLTELGRAHLANADPCAARPWLTRALELGADDEVLAELVLANASCDAPLRM